VERNTVLWALVLFFGASIVFGTLRRVTEDEPAGVVIAVQVGALVLIIAVLVLVARRLRR